MLKRQKKTNKLLGNLLRNFQSDFSMQDESVEQMWEKVSHPTVFAQTKAVNLDRGVLTVAVKNSTLYSLLSIYEKKKLVEDFNKHFPERKILDIHFKMG